MQILIFLMALIAVHEACAQTGLEMIKAKWKQKKYAEVISLGRRYRETLQGKGIPALDYMILTSICMQSDPRSRVCGGIRLALKDYYRDLRKSDYELMEQGFNRICRQNGEPDPTIFDKLSVRQHAHGRGTALMSSRFKTYMLVSEGLRNRGVFSEISFDEIRNISETLISERDSPQQLNEDLIDTYTLRRIRKNDSLAIKKAAKRFMIRSRYWASDNFLLITSRSNRIDLKKVAANMERVLGFYKDAYEMSTPEEYIVVYLARDYRSVRPQVGKLYSRNISFDPLGYSNFYDNSMLAWIPGEDRIGTLKHELVHLLLRSKFSIVPEWFEEGLAALYEESVFDSSSHLQGRENWRGMLLKETSLKVYTLGNLFANDSANFTSDELVALREEYRAYIAQSDYRGLIAEDPQAVNEVLTVLLTNRMTLYKDALSRYFLLYLQDKKKLDKLYQGLITREQSVMDIENYQSLESVILNVCGQSSITALEQDFSLWLKDVYKSMR